MSILTLFDGLKDLHMNRSSKVQTKDAAVIGETVFLRPPASHDQEEFIALNRTSKRLHRGLVSPPIKPEHFDALMQNSRRTDYVGFFICRMQDGAIVGSITLSQIFRSGFQSAYLGYYIGEQYANRGYMTEALQLMLRYAFSFLKLHRLEANIQPENVASIALVRRAGFIREGYSRRYLKVCGRWRDHERWALVAEDWKAKRNG